MSSRDALWARLRDAGTVSGDPPPFDPPSPWYVRALLGAAGWLAALCLLGFVAVAGSVLVDTESMAIVAGIAMIGGAAALLRPSVTNPFVTQLGMAVSCAGQALVIFGTVETIGNDVSATVAIAVFEAALAALVPNYVHRVLSAAAAAVAMTLALTWLGAYFLAAGLLAAIAAWLWSREFEWGDLGATMRPIAYGVTLALVGVHGTWIGSALLRDVFAGESTPQWFPRWLGLSVATLVLAGVVVRLLREARQPVLAGQGLIVIAATLALCAASFQAPGIPTGLAILLLGFARGNRILMGIGVAASLGFISAYYYLVETTLLVKSQTLIATGLVILAARWALTRGTPEDADVEHAAA
jgi:hypothetical protein